VKLFAYIKNAKGPGKRLQKVIESINPGIRIEIFRTVEELLERMHQPLNRPVIIVLLLKFKKELVEILSHQSLFYDTWNILILPEGNETMMKMGLKLYPRYISFTNSDLKDVELVLKKMLVNVNSKRKP